MCGSPVIAKCGSMVVWHWAHASRDDCDSWSESETEWHAAWKSRFNSTEVTITKLIGDTAVRHRADAVSASGKVIEFQHSSISPKEVAERERFYGNMAWVIDGSEAFWKNRIGLDLRHPEDGSEYVRFRWKSRRRSFDNATAPLFIDLGLSFRDIGEPFKREGEWYDDGSRGLRDGFPRSPGVWRRTQNSLWLLEVKKHSDGYGWGRLISHHEFCFRAKERHVAPVLSCRGLRRCDADRWDGDGFAYRRYVDQWTWTTKKVGSIGSWHSWCHEILNPSKDGVETA
jgi:hypothetical protein